MKKIEPQSIPSPRYHPQNRNMIMPNRLTDPKQTIEVDNPAFE